MKNKRGATKEITITSHLIKGTGKIVSLLILDFTELLLIFLVLFIDYFWCLVACPYGRVGIRMGQKEKLPIDVRELKNVCV